MSPAAGWTLVAGAIVALAAARTLARIVREGRIESAPAADAIVAFGAGVWASGPSRTMRVRTATAARLYAEGKAPVVLCTGGCTNGRSEAGAMRDLLVEAGVPRDAIVADDGGASTRMGIRSARLIGAGAWSSMLAVSSPWHLYRIRREAERQGVRMAGFPARRDGPATRSLRIHDARQHLRELAAVWAYAVRGLADRALDNAAGRVAGRATTHLRARLAFLLRDADAVAAAGASIGATIKRRVADFSDTRAVLTPASGLRAPVDGRRGSPFGLRHGRLHAGLDIRAPYGSRVVASAAGTVLFTGWMEPYGNVVVLDHGGGLSTVSSHLSEVAAVEGEPVAEGDPIGRVGDTGRASGPHLHFEVRVHGSPVDPAAYLPDADPGSAHHGQHNAAWVESIHFRGHDPKKPRRVLRPRHTEALAATLRQNGVRHAYLFAGPFDADGSLPAWASSATAKASVRRLAELAPDVAVLPWIGGLQRGTVRLDDPRWVGRALDDTARLIDALGVRGVHVDIELTRPECAEALALQRIAPDTPHLPDYAARHVDFHRALRSRLPAAFLSTAIPTTSSLARSWKIQHTPEQAAELASWVDQVALLCHDSAIRDAGTYQASLIDLLRHIADWKRRPPSMHVQCLLSVGAFVNPRPLRHYRDVRVEGLRPHFAALDRAIAEVQRDVRLVDGIAIYGDWTIPRRDWRRFRSLWSGRAD